MTIDPTIRGVCESFTPAQTFAELVQAIVTAEGGNQAIIRAVQCSDNTITTLDAALRVVCRSAIHRMSDYVKATQVQAFTTYMGSFWAPIGTANDPHGLNKYWPKNVAALWNGEKGIVV